jgi:hypothetical protein
MQRVDQTLGLAASVKPTLRTRLLGATRSDVNGTRRSSGADGPTPDTDSRPYTSTSRPHHEQIWLCTPAGRSAQPSTAHWQLEQPVPRPKLPDSAPAHPDGAQSLSHQCPHLGWPDLELGLCGRQNERACAGASIGAGSSHVERWRWIQLGGRRAELRFELCARSARSGAGARRPNGRCAPRRAPSCVHARGGRSWVNDAAGRSAAHGLFGATSSA